MQKDILDPILQKLQEIEVDAQSMEYLIRHTDTEHEILKQLIMKEDIQLILDLIKRRIQIMSTL